MSETSERMKVLNVRFDVPENFNGGFGGMSGSECLVFQPYRVLDGVFPHVAWKTRLYKDCSGSGHYGSD